MPDYKSMYFHLAAKVADAIDILMAAQQQGEDQYMTAEQSAPIRLADEAGKDNDGKE